LTADTRNEYSVPFVSPGTVTVIAVDPPSSNADHDVPPFDEYSTT
jgi:hypothetical protein